MMTKSHALENKYNAEDDVKKIQENEESKTSLEKLPTPTGWRLLVMPFKVKEETKGGIIIAQETLDRARVATQVGYVLKMGDLCYIACKMSSGLSIVPSTSSSFNILISPPSISMRDPAYLAKITQSFCLHQAPVGYLSLSS